MSFYFFDFDDNIMFLTTPVYVRNTKTGDIKSVSTHEFATIRQFLGQAGEWLDYEQFEGTYEHFGDKDASKIADGEKQFFVEDVAQALTEKPEKWKAPSWDLFVYACENRRPAAIVTARGHSRETIKAGVKILVDAGLLPNEPDYLEIYAVNNPEMKEELAKGLSDDDREAMENGKDQTSKLKRVAINNIVEKAVEKYGAGHPHRFGMSDDDPKNVELIIKAMCDSKKRHMDMRFFVIDTHENEHVKLEVFPIDHPVVGNPDGDQCLT